MPHAAAACIGFIAPSVRRAGQNLKGHRFACAALLYEYTDAGGRVQWARALVGALLHVKGRSLPFLLGDLAGQWHLPHAVRHVWVVDRGLLTHPLLRALDKLQQFALGRVKANQVVYFAPRRQPKKGRKKTYSVKCGKAATSLPTRPALAECAAHHVGGRLLGFGQSKQSAV